VRVLTDETGVVTDTRGYEAFGARNVTTGSDSLAFGFAGEQFEANSKLAYHRARWMDPTGGRFVGMDTFSGFASAPSTLQKYRYVGSNPVNATDPSGQMDMVDISISIVVVNVLAATSGVYGIAKNPSISLKQVGQTASKDLLLVAIHLYPMAAVPFEAAILAKALTIVDDTERSTSDPKKAFDDLVRQRNSSYEKSQDLSLAAAEHYFFARQEAQNDPGWPVVMNVVGVFGYDFLKVIGTSLTFGLGRYSPLITGTSYPATPPTVAAVVCGTWGFLKGPGETQPQ
jgi:RHS repeat-associated protein